MTHCDALQQNVTHCNIVHHKIYAPTHASKTHTHIHTYTHPCQSVSRLPYVAVCCSVSYGIEYRRTRSCSVLQCVAACCSVLQRVTEYRIPPSSKSPLHPRVNTLQHTATHYNTCVAMCCSVLQCIVVTTHVLQCVAVCCSELRSVAECCRVLQCVKVALALATQSESCALQGDAVCCSVLQSVAERCSVL